MLRPRADPLRVPAATAKMQFASSGAIVSSHHLASIGIERGCVVLHVRPIARATRILDESMASCRR